MASMRKIGTKEKKIRIKRSQSEERKCLYILDHKMADISFVNTHFRDILRKTEWKKEIKMSSKVERKKLRNFDGKIIVRS